MRTLDTGVGSGIGGALLAGSAPALTAFPPVSARGGGVSTSRGSFGTLCARRRAVVLRFGAPARPGVGIGRRGAAVPARAASSSRLGAKRARARACGAVVDTPAALCRLRRGADGLHCHRRLQGRLGRPADARLVHTDLWRRLEPRGARTVGGHGAVAGRVRPPQRTVPYQTRLELFVRGILTEYNTIYLGNIIYLGSQKEWLTGLRGLKRYTAFRGGLSRAPRPRPPRARPYHPFGLNG